MTQLTALVQMPAQSGLALLCERADALGAHVTREADGAVIEANSGTITARASGEGVQLTLSADSDAALQMLRSAIDGFAHQGGLALPDWRSPPAPERSKSRLIAAQLVSKRLISPSYCRIRLAGDFTVFARGGLHFRLLIGPEGSPLPEAKDGEIHWPGGIDAWHRPPYTVRDVSPDGDWLDCDIYLHLGGRVTEWCADVQPGARVMLTGPGGRGVKQAAWMGMVGDETALPVILRAIAAASPDARGEVRILIRNSHDAQEISTPPGLDLRWIPRSEGLSAGDLLRALALPAATRFVFFAAEREEAEAARAWAKTVGLNSGEFLGAAYWTRGWQPPQTQRQPKGITLRATAFSS